MHARPRKSKRKQKARPSILLIVAVVVLVVAFLARRLGASVLLLTSG